VSNQNAAKARVTYPKSLVSPRQPPRGVRSKGVTSVAVPIPSPMPAWPIPLAIPSSSGGNQTAIALVRLAKTRPSARPKSTIANNIIRKLVAVARRSKARPSSAVPQPTLCRAPKWSPRAPAGMEETNIPSEIPAHRTPHCPICRPRSPSTSGTTMMIWFQAMPGTNMLTSTTLASTHQRYGGRSIRG
jgi:hypothetical protein